MYKIGEFSKLSKITVRMLRHYDEVGLLNPTYIDDFTGYRYYSFNKLLKTKSIVEYRDMGFSISEISELLNSDEIVVKQILLKKAEEVKENINLENDKLQQIEYKIENFGKDKMMDNKVEVKAVPSVKVISLRDIIPNYYAEGQLWEKLEQYAEENKVKLTSDVHSTGITTYYDEEWKESDCDTEVCMKVEELGKSEGNIVFKELDSIEKVACIKVEGNYDKLSAAYIILGQWIEENKYAICGNCRQISIKHPNNESNPDNYLTEIQIPIKEVY